MDQFLSNTKQKMNKIYSLFENELIKFNVGKGGIINVISNIMINIYGKKKSIGNIANISPFGSYQLVIRPYDSSLISLIVSAINNYDISLMVSTDNNSLIRLKIPSLTEEERLLLVRNMRKKVEEFKIFIRNERRIANEYIKSNKILSRDNKKYYEVEIQKLTDLFIKKINDFSKNKEAELMKV